MDSGHLSGPLGAGTVLHEAETLFFPTGGSLETVRVFHGVLFQEDSQCGVDRKLGVECQHTLGTSGLR